MMRKKLVALAMFAVFVLVFMLEAGYGSGTGAEADEKKASCPEGYVALSSSGGIICAEKTSFCGCEERYLIIEADGNDVVCKDLSPVNVTLGVNI